MDNLISEITKTKTHMEQDPHSFSMDYVSISGRRFGIVPEWETRLTVDGSGHAILFRRRGPGESAERPPGRYQGQIPTSSLLGFLDTLAASGIQDYRPDAPGPQDPINFLRLCLRGRLFTFSWGVSRNPMPAPMAQLKRLLAEWVEKACPTSIWSLALKVDSLDFQNGILRSNLRVENLGRQAIHIANPASPGFGPRFGIHLSYGEVQLIQEGITPDPVDEKETKLSVAPLQFPELIEITPSHTYAVEFSATLEMKAPRGWIGAFSFLHYLPEDTIAGIPVFNGALFSENLRW